MKFDPKVHHRRSVRLPEYDYASNGAYFVTMVTYQRDMLFGNIKDGVVALNDLGTIADACWREIPIHFEHVELGAYVVMPNHVHGIVVINHNIPVGATHASPLRESTRKSANGPAPHSLGAIVGSFKSAVSKRINREHNATGIWQRNYYEHIIRDQKDLQRITDYIEMNPSRWDEDEENTQNCG